MCSLLAALAVWWGYRPLDDLLPREVASTSSLRQGLRFAFTGNTAVALVTWSVIGYGIALGLTNQSMTPLAVEGLHISLAAYGWIPAAFAVGGLTAYGLTSRLNTRLGTTSVLLLGAVLLAAGYLAYGTAGSLQVCVVAMLVAGVGFALWQSVQGAILQASVPPSMMAAYLAGLAPLTPLASLLGSQVGRLLVEAGVHSSPTLGYRLSYLSAALAVLVGAVFRLVGRRQELTDAS